ncbi:potassium transporter TrkA [Christiangramia fulva]|uniref:Potassium transporter TrkA n=1 Tax=Christiangramia fulva TaxID=2126553 RepID=A0A2R3Z4I4_9FLAO|nr:TrkA family potassium uptake protein [Christiangramia fulva]AVR45175.1 potassium transporter TrkA [Christiangramia fulva]
MKYIIVGLGNFGASLAEKLSSLGNEVIGVDVSMPRIESLKNKITHVISLDATDKDAVMSLPYKDADTTIIAIGEDPGASILATAVMQQLHVKRLISRAISPLQQLVLEAMGVREIIHPEEETADRWSMKLNMPGVYDSFELNPQHNVVEVEVPSAFDGKSLQELSLRKNYNLIVLTTMKYIKEKNKLGIETSQIDVQDLASAKTVLHEGDLMVVYGHTKNIKKLIKSFS